AWDLARRGHDLHLFIKDDIIHETALTLASFLWKRFRYMRKHHHERGRIRRWSLVRSRDLPRLVLFVLASLTLVLPTLDALRGFRKRADPAWFLNPVVCLGITLVYGLGTLLGLMPGFARSGPPKGP